MGGYLAMPLNQQGRDYVNLFLDNIESLGDPNDWISQEGGIGFESYIGVSIKPVTDGPSQSLK